MCMLVRLETPRVPQETLDTLSMAVGREIAADEWGSAAAEFETDADRRTVLAAALEAGVHCLVLGDGKGSLATAGRLYEAGLDEEGNVAPVPEDAPLRSVVAARRISEALEERRLHAVPEGEGPEGQRRRVMARLETSRAARIALYEVCRVMETLDVEGVVEAAVAASEGCLARHEAVMELEAWVEEAVVRSDKPPEDIPRDACFHVMAAAILAGGDMGEPMDFDEAARRILGFPP